MTTRTWKNKPVADLVRCEPYPENLPKIKEIDSITNLPAWRAEDGGRALYNDMVVRLKIYTNAIERRSMELTPLKYTEDTPWVLGHYTAERGRHFDRYWLWFGLHGYMITERLYKELLPEAQAFKASLGFSSVPGAKPELATPDLCEMAMEVPMMSAFLLGGLCVIENGVVEISTETYNGESSGPQWAKYGRMKAPVIKGTRDPYEPLDPRDHGLLAPISPAFFSSALLVQAGKSLFAPDTPTTGGDTGIPDTKGLVKRAKVTKPTAANLDFSEEEDA